MKVHFQVQEFGVKIMKRSENHTYKLSPTVIKNEFKTHTHFSLTNLTSSHPPLPHPKQNKTPPQKKPLSHLLFVLHQLQLTSITKQVKSKYNTLGYNFLRTSRDANLKVCKFPLTYENELQLPNYHHQKNPSNQTHLT